MRRMSNVSYFRVALPFIVAPACALASAGCEAVLGAEFDDFTTFGDDGSAHDSDASRGGSADVNAGAGRAGGGSGGASDAGAGAGTGGVDDSGRSGSGGASTGGSTGIEDADGRAGSGGAAGSVSIVDAGEQSDARDVSVRDATSDVSVRDATSDATVVDDVASQDSTNDAATDAATDLTTPPSRDGSTGGGACIPNEVRSIAFCGNCGLFLQVCNAQGAWDPPFCRQEPAACAPGSIERRVCPTGGTQVATCNTSCTWSLGECVAPPCTAGQTEVLPCSLCGTQTRTCLATEGGLAWGPFSVCGHQGVCAPGTPDVTTCGKCGTYSRVCTPKCAWDPWGACQGEGACFPGTTETRTCTIIPFVLGKQTRSCGASCNWGAYGPCK
jgi:hypothetical protein